MLAELIPERIEPDHPPPAPGTIELPESHKAVPTEAYLAEVALQVFAIEAVIDAVVGPLARSAQAINRAAVEPAGAHRRSGQFSPLAASLSLTNC